MKKIFLLTLFIVASFLNTKAQYTKLLDFAGTTNGNGPYGDLISDGTFLYGMTRIGGANNQGTIFKIMPDGTGYTKLFDFISGTTGPGYGPRGSLYFDGTFLYGTTVSGGSSDMGTIFKIMPDGTGFVRLFNFTGTANGSNPVGTLISDGTFLYGAAQGGGTNSMGTLFKIMPNGTGFVKLLDFAGVSNGSTPAYGPLYSDGTYL